MALFKKPFFKKHVLACQVLACQWHLSIYKHAPIRMQRCILISKQSVRNFRRFKIFNKRLHFYLYRLYRMMCGNKLIRAEKVRQTDRDKHSFLTTRTRTKDSIPQGQDKDQGRGLTSLERETEKERILVLTESKLFYGQWLIYCF